MRVGAFTKYGSEAASTRYRLLQYLPSLNAAGFHVDYYPLLDNDYVRSLTTGQRTSAARIAFAYARRFVELLRSRDLDLVWVYAELFPYLPAAFERLAFRAGKTVVYDFDDAFFLPYEKSSLLAGKIDGLIAGAGLCCCGNEYLRDYAMRLNRNAIIIPTVVDADLYRPARDHGMRSLTIGWIGSPTTWTYVRPILPVLERFCHDQNARFLVVGGGTGAATDRFLEMEVRAWDPGREIADVQEMDVGIMPLPDEPWAQGKSGFKLIQYMACGLPVVASPVGVNRLIVDDGIHGFLARGPDEWRDALERLARSSELRRERGEAGRRRVLAHYSLQSQAPRLIEALRAAASLKPVTGAEDIAPHPA